MVFPDDWNVTFTPNRWSNEEKTLEYIDKVMLPFTRAKQEELRFRAYQPALVIYDEFKGQLTDSVHSVLNANHMYVVKVPPNCTDRLCSQWIWLSTDQRSNFCARNFMWYSEQVEQKLIKQD